MTMERPLRFTGTLASAILDGRKTQTRRVIKPQPEVSDKGWLTGEWLSRPLNGLLCPRLQDIAIECPYGRPGDLVWGESADGGPRFLLQITGVRVEHLQDISHDDACAEGIHSTRGGFAPCRDRFRELWEAINGPGAWEANPWVWAMNFRRADAPVNGR